MTYAEIVFTGIITFITPTDGRPATAVALNVPEPVASSRGDTIPAHVTWLRFDLNDLEADSPVQPDAVVELGGRQHGVVFLRGEEVSVATPSTNSDLVIVDGIPGDGELPTPQNKEFLYWVPRLRDILGRELAINPAYLDRQPNADLLAMRFELNRGRLSTSLVPPVAWEFRPMLSTPFRRAMAQEVALRIALGGPLTLKLTRFGGSASRLVKFVRADTRVMIGNTPHANIAGGTLHEHGANVDHHFELYYRILAEPPHTVPLPYRSITSFERGGRRRVISHGGNGMNCGPDRVP